MQELLKSSQSGVGSPSCCCVWHVNREESSNRDLNDGYCLLCFLQGLMMIWLSGFNYIHRARRHIISNCLRCGSFGTLIFFSRNCNPLNSLFSAFSLCISGWFDTSISLVYEPAYPRYAQCCVQFCASVFWGIFNPIETPRLHSLHCRDEQESRLCHIFIAYQHELYKDE
jgi:hypothetical protein